MPQRSGLSFTLDEDQAGAEGVRSVAPPPAKASLKRSLLLIPMKVLLVNRAMTREDYNP
jgi:hypothetical protein